MTTLKQRLIAEVVEREGGYVNHSADRGGATNYGITQAVARANGYQGDMRDFPLGKALDIYETKYWDSLKLDQIIEISESLAVYLFDYGVNSGTGRAGKELQVTLNVLNDRQKLYPDIKEDGAIGAKTLDSLKAFRKARSNSDVEVLADVINGCRIAFCRDLAHRKESQEAFTMGWFRRITELPHTIKTAECSNRAINLYTEAKTEL